MVDQRLLRLFHQRETIDGDRVFGVTNDLFANTTPTAPVQRVALFSEAFLPKVDGVTRTAYLTVRYLQQTGREVLIFAPDLAVSVVGASRVVRLPAVSMPQAPETRLAFPTARIGREVAAFAPDVIHLFSPALMSSAAVWYARRHRIPIVANFQTDLPGYAREYSLPWLAAPLWRYLKTLHNACDRTLSPGPTISALLRTHGLRRIETWERGVDAHQFAPRHRDATMRRRLMGTRDHDNALLCLYVGRLAREKGLSLLRPVADLARVHLAFVGDGKERERLEHLFAGTNTTFTGYLHGVDLQKAYASADLFLFPGPVETFGQVVLEALASGLPAVVGDRGAVRDLVDAGKTGLVVRHDGAAFAQAVAQLRDLPEVRYDMSRRARERALQNPWSAVMQKLEDHYIAVIDAAYRAPHQQKPRRLHYPSNTRRTPS